MSALRLLHAPGSNMQPGRGERREGCGSYERCLDGWARTSTAYAMGPEAHCDPRCPSFEPRDGRAALDDFASARRSA